jgi:hypothetical protein
LRYRIPGPPKLSPLVKIGGSLPGLSLAKALEMALYQIDQYYLEAEKD